VARTLANGAALAASMNKSGSAAGSLAALGARLDKVGLPQAANVLRPVRAVPTCFPWVDTTLGISGWPTDRYALVHGPSNKGKSVFTLGLCYSFVQSDHPALYIDAERTTPITWARQLMGAHADSPIFRAKKPKSYEETVADVRAFCEAIGEAKAKGEVDENTTGIVIVDSLRKLVPQKMLDQMMKEFSDTATQGRNDRKGIDGANGMAARIKAALNAQWADELTALLDDTGTCLVAIAREYQKQKVNDWDLDYVLGGGSAIFFEASVTARIDESGRVLDDDKRLLATEHSVSILKTKVGHKEERYPRAFFHLASGAEEGVPYGFDRARDVLVFARHLGLVTGGWNAFNGQNLGQGESNALRLLRNDPGMLRRVETACRLSKVPVDAVVEVVEGGGQEIPAMEQNAPKDTPSPKQQSKPARTRASATKGKQAGKGPKR